VIRAAIAQSWLLFRSKEIMEFQKYSGLRKQGKLLAALEAFKEATFFRLTISVPGQI
jgi:hypothetical protein